MPTGLEIETLNIQKQIAFHLSRLVLKIDELNENLERIATVKERELELTFTKEYGS